MTTRLALPVLPLRDSVLFPGVATPVTIGRLKTLRAIEAALAQPDEHKRLFAVAQCNDAEEATADALHVVGVVARIAEVERFGAGLQLVLQCERRVRAVAFSEIEGWIRAVLVEHPDVCTESPQLYALSREVREKAVAYGRQRGAPEDVLRHFLRAIEDPASLANHVAFYADLSSSAKQTALESSSILDRLRRLSALLDAGAREDAAPPTPATRRPGLFDEALGSAAFGAPDGAGPEGMGDAEGASHREPSLRDQIRALQREAAFEDGSPTARLAERLESADLPPEAAKEVARELGRLQRMGREGSAEAHMLTTWLECVADLPWNARTQDRFELEGAKAVLDEGHHGLDTVKERIVEFLAVRKLRAKRASSDAERARSVSKGPILLFSGPPGTGKTSVAEAIAKALGREYVRISLGGARDEADVRGHRRTYVGAMPGRIVTALRRAKTKNPVLLLDEIDKLGAGVHGDPSAALLEVLDPAQNKSFVDHYLGLPFDLSEVLFICTANEPSGMLAPLIDRMEPIRFSGYTEKEKVSIARAFLLPRQLEEAGLDAEQLEISDEALDALVTGYTREAGVRQLERQVGALARKAAKRIASGEVEREVLETAADVERLLGKPPRRGERRLDRDEPGIATGVCYQAAGGDILFIEAQALPGRGRLNLTGQLGDVMKESGHAALTFARTHAALLGPLARDPEDCDVHVHVPAGAVPKDGPSAGVAMAAAILSALSGRPVRSHLAMTGEITLRGRVLPVGGVREKALGAFRAGIREMLLPADNMDDIESLPEEVAREMRFHPVSTLAEALALALCPAAEPTSEEEAPPASSRRRAARLAS